MLFSSGVLVRGAHRGSLGILRNWYLLPLGLSRVGWCLICVEVIIIILNCVDLNGIRVGALRFIGRQTAFGSGLYQADISCIEGKVHLVHISDL